MSYWCCTYTRTNEEVPKEEYELPMAAGACSPFSSPRLIYSFLKLQRFADQDTGQSPEKFGDHRSFPLMAMGGDT
jgi:hypothetical protein